MNTCWESPTSGSGPGSPWRRSALSECCCYVLKLLATFSQTRSVTRWQWVKKRT